ncbi:hypothetical protein ACP6PL_30700 [Dapis sp. BLCC M126]|uniref:hypothetical protein n=1 Tax=Dapis sp. BLCC M126 TaxID=3400189 RepID=UPI003CEFE357
MSKDKKILFFAPYSGPWAWFLHTRVDAVLATSLQIRGCDVLVVGCDGIYQDCYIIRGVGDRKQEFCQICSQAGHKFFSEDFKLPYIQLREFITDEDYQVAFEWLETVNPSNYRHAVYQDLALGEWVSSSIYTFFRITARTLSNLDVRKVHRQYLIDGLLTYRAISKIFSDYQPTNMFLFGARLAPYRVAFETARKFKIDVIVQEKGYVDGSYRFFDNHHCLSQQLLIDFCNAWQNTPLTQFELEEVKQYFVERESGQNMNGEKYYEYKTEYIDVLNKLNIPLDAKIFAIFTSSEDELAMYEEYEGVTKQLDVIDSLIEIFSKRNEYLVIRHHPNIWGGRFNQGEIDFLSRAYKQALSAPSNVKIVMPSEELTSYALLWHTDAAISFFSTMSIEATVRGIPTASFERSIYRQALRYTINSSAPEYLEKQVDYLMSELAKPTLEDLRKLYRFTHAYFHKFSVKFSSFDTRSIKYESNEELKPGNDPILDKVCDRIIDGSSMYNLPNVNCVDEKEIENEFLFQELQEITQEQKKVKLHTLEKSHVQSSLPLGIIYLDFHNDSENKQVLSNWRKRLRYQNITFHNCDNCQGKNHRDIIQLLSNCLENIEEDYVLVTNSFIQQYNESLGLSEMEILTANNNEIIQGVLFGGWLPFSQRTTEYRIFTKQTIFTIKDLVTTKEYKQAMASLPLLYYVPISILGFTIISKNRLLSILKTAQEILIVSQLSEYLFQMVVTSDSVHKLELPMLVVDDNSITFQELWGKDLENVLGENLRLRDINLIIFPDWKQPEDDLYEEIASVIRAIANNQNKQKITLLIDTTNISDEDADMAISGIAMNLLMEENLNVEDGPEIALIGKMGWKGWQALLRLSSGRIILKNENKAIISSIEADVVPVLNLESFTDEVLLPEKRE